MHECLELILSVEEHWISMSKFKYYDAPKKKIEEEDYAYNQMEGDKGEVMWGERMVKRDGRFFGNLGCFTFNLGH